MNIRHHHISEMTIIRSASFVTPSTRLPGRISPWLEAFWLDESRPLKCQAAFRSGLFHYDVAARFPSDEQVRLHAQSYKICSGNEIYFPVLLYNKVSNWYPKMVIHCNGFHLTCSWKVLMNFNLKNFRSDWTWFHLVLYQLKSWKNG